MPLIFVVDDEPLVLDLIATVLRLDCHVITAMADPVAACGAIIGAHPPIDLLITDADMKPLSGFQMVKSIREKHVSCPVIFMSGHPGLAAIIADSFGQLAVIEKPFTAAELRLCVHKALAVERSKPHHDA